MVQSACPEADSVSASEGSSQLDTVLTAHATFLYREPDEFNPRPPVLFL